MRIFRWIHCLIVLALMAVFASAQTPTGTIEGAVTDNTGAAIQGASITIVQTATNGTRTTLTDASGRFVIPFVEPGTYTVGVEAKGFRSAKQDEVVVQVTETRAVNFKLTVGSVAETVQVNATAESLDVDTSTLGETIQSDTLLDLPDNGRNPFDFAALVPGVNTTGGASTPHIGGSRNGNNEQQIDGMTNILPENNVGNNSTAYQPIMDSVQEINVQTSSLSAEYGRYSGGTISLITKSGTNQLHGSFFEFIQNGAMDAVPYGSPGVVNTNKKPDQHQYQTGGTIGGPIVLPGYNGHNKSFFFFDYENQHQAQGSTSNYSVPNPNWLSGDFTGIYGATTPSLFDPYQQPTQDANGNYVRAPLVGDDGSYNKIPARYLASSGSQIAQAALKYFPSPNRSGSGTNNLYNNFQQTGSVPNDYWHYDAKIDQDVTKKWHSFLRFSQWYGDSSVLNDYGNAASPGNYGGATNYNELSVSFNNTVTFSDKLLGEFRLGFSKSNSNRVPIGGNFNPTQLGFSSSYAAEAALDGQIFPHFGFSGNGGFSDLGPLGYEPLQEDPLAADLNASIVKIIGGHSIKVGGEFRELRLNFYQYTYPSGTFTADDSWTRQYPQTQDSTGFSVASLLLGLPSGGDLSNDPKVISTSQYVALYAQDDWKVSPKLTLNFGLRWDTDIPREEQNNQMTFWNPFAPSPLQSSSVASNVTASGVTCPACGNLLGTMSIVGMKGAQYGRRQGPVQKNDFGPRLGMAYNPTPRIVVRAGGGLVYQGSAMQAAGTSGAPGIEGFSTQTNFSPSFTNQDNPPIADLGNPFPNGFNSPQAKSSTCLASAACIQGIDIGNQLQQSYFDSYRTPYEIEWNANVQYSLPGDIKFELGYLGQRGLFLINGDPGQPYDQLSPSLLSQYGCIPGAASSACGLLTQVANPFYGIIGTFPYTLTGTSLGSSATVPQGQLLKHWPQYTNVSSFRKPGARSIYNAFTLRADKQFSHGLAFTFSFTDGRDYNNGASSVNYLGAASQTYADQYNPGAEWGIGAQNISYDIAATARYELPFGRGKMFLNSGGSAENVFVNGWQIVAENRWNTGTPIVPSSFDNGTTAESLWANNAPFSQRPELVPGQKTKIADQSYRQWFNPIAFAKPASFVIGNAPRTLGTVNNPSYEDLDAALEKNTRFKERYNAQIRLELFNALNHPVLSGPNTSITSGQFGQITGYSNTQRLIQVAAKFVF